MKDQDPQIESVQWLVWIVEGVDLLLGSKDETANAAKEAHHNRQDGYQSESAK